ARSYSSRGVCEGASVASAPPAVGFCGDCPGCAPVGGPMVARSSGAAAPRPPGAPIGGSPASAPTIGAPPGGVTAPSVWGAPGAFGFWAGSNASPRRPGGAVGDDGAGRVCGGGCAAP